MTKQKTFVESSFPKWEEKISFNEYSINNLDAEALQKNNENIINLINQLKTINNNITTYERKKTVLDNNYKRKYREVFLTIEAKNETHRRILAEIECEDLEQKILYLDEIIRELTRMAMNTRFELEALKTIANNLRQEMRI